MARKPRKTDDNAPKEDLKSFIEEMHGEGSTALPQEGLPSIEWLKEQFQTKSAIIRYLINQGFDVKTITKHLGLRYQHVRNVATGTLKRGPNEDWRKPLIEGTQIPDPKQFKPEED
jgi:hypothetical protein